MDDRIGSAPPAATAWHAVPVAETAAAFAVDPAAGLSEAEAAARLARHGENRLPEPPRRGPLRRFLAQFENLLILVLIGAAAVTAALGHGVDTAVILAVVLANAVIGFVQEGRAENALAAIRHMLAPAAAVLRGGVRRTVPGENLVPGDVVMLSAGDRAPADIRLTEARGLAVEEAALTGESVAVEKQTGPVDAHAPLGDRRSLVFSSTLIARGQARGIVVATGGATEIGRIGGMIAAVESVQTPLLRRMGVFARWLTAVILAAAALILAAGTLSGAYGFSELFMAVVGLSVAAIPEGLPAILTVTLAIGVQGMARRNAIVRRLPAIEALGSVTTICSDKTGTLTRNEMTVGRLVTAAGSFAVEGTGYGPDGAIRFEGEGGAETPNALVTAAARAALLASEAEIAHGDGEFTVLGDPMEGALVAFAMKAGLDPAHERRTRPEHDLIPFDARHRFMASLRRDHAGTGTVFVKGAPERLIAMADSVLGRGDACEAIDHAGWQAQAEALAAQGFRVLALACRDAPRDMAALTFADVEQGLSLIGLVGLIDPPREEAVAAVAECRAAGIRVKMITGDHAGTAAAIARALGLENTALVTEGAAIDAMDDAALRARVRESDVFARVSPEHKLRLVTALQASGEVVAMTGDGVNDAPALKRADVGVAMGRKGTEAAKEAAEIVLADDNFATIAAAVRAGRTVYDNLRKAVVFLLPVNGGESMSLVIALLAGLTLPITPLQILWVNMVSSVVLAMTLAFEPAEPGIMRRPPRPPGEPLLSRFVIWRIGFVSVLFCTGIFASFEIALLMGADVETARTVAVNALVAMEIFYLFAVRYLGQSSISWTGVLGTRPVLIAVGAVTLLQILFTYAPFMETFFDTRALSLAEGALAVAAGLFVLAALEAEKQVQRLIARPVPA